MSSSTAKATRHDPNAARARDSHGTPGSAVTTTVRPPTATAPATMRTNADSSRR
jgi:hypothetical protein